MYKRIISILISIFVLFTSTYAYASVCEDQTTVNSSKEYYKNKKFLVLGDSIAYGHLLESKDQCYSKILSNKLSMQYTNVAENGATSTQLLEKMDDESIRDQIKNSDIINISIGGNDIMQPILSLIKEKTNSVYDEDIDYGELISIYQNFSNDLLTGVYDEQISKDAQNGYNDFQKMFPQILKKINEINPNAKIITQTIYNPLLNIEDYTHIADLLDIYITNVNNLITSETSKYNNIVNVDVYNYLKDESGKYISNINSFDIHPNKYGHYDIYLCIYKELIHEYPDDIKINIENAEYKIVYSKDTLSPYVYIKAPEGFNPPINIHYKNKELPGFSKCIQIKDGEYEYLIKPHSLYYDVEIYDKLDISNAKDKNVSPNQDQNVTPNQEQDVISNEKLSKEVDDDEYDNSNSNSKNLKTSDYALTLFAIFVVCFIISLTYKIKQRIRKEKVK